jgi:diaminopimelate epimerase
MTEAPGSGLAAAVVAADGVAAAASVPVAVDGGYCMMTWLRANLVEAFDVEIDFEVEVEVDFGAAADEMVRLRFQVRP